MTKRLRMGLVMLISSMAAYASGDPTVEELRVATENLRQVLIENRAELEANPAELKKALQEVTTKHFDMTRISRLALGKNWRKINAGQRSRFIVAFEGHVLKMYGNVLLQNLNRKIVWSRPPGDEAKKYVTVRASVENPDGPRPIEIDFRMRKSPEYDNIRVYDVRVDGISLVINFRTQFNNHIQNYGFESLVKRLGGKGA